MGYSSTMVPAPDISTAFAPVHMAKQKAAAKRKRNYGKTVSLERLQQLHHALPDVSQEELLDDFRWFESYTALVERQARKVAFAQAEQQARIMAAGFSRQSWEPLCKSGPHTPERVQIHVNNTLDLAEAAALKHPDATIQFVLTRERVSEYCSFEFVEKYLSEKWDLCGFFMREGDRNAYAEVGGPCSNRTGAVGYAHTIAFTMCDEMWGLCPVLLPDGTYCDFENDPKLELFQDYLGNNGVGRFW